MISIAQNLSRLHDQIGEACTKAGRLRQDITLIAVSKFQPISAIEQAIAAGQLDFGENYAQEFAEKVVIFKSLAKFHFIGALQRNKVRFIAGQNHLIHTVDRPSLVQEIAQFVKNHPDSAPQECLIQINIDNEPQKAGCTIEQLPALLDAFLQHSPYVKCTGIMGIPKPAANPQSNRPAFKKLYQIFSRPQPGFTPQHLSMGMSADFSVAIEEGATMIRIGTAIFGERSKTL